MKIKKIPASAKNYTKAFRGVEDITEICIHHTAGCISLETLGKIWQNPNRHGSSNYGIKDGEVAQFVEDKDIAWCNSNWESNSRSLSVEICNSTGAPSWEVSDESLDSLRGLLVTLCQKYKIKKLIYQKNLTIHQQYTATACPGPYLLKMLPMICTQVNEMIETLEAPIGLTVFKNIQPVTKGDANTIAQLLDDLRLDYDTIQI